MHVAYRAYFTQEEMTEEGVLIVVVVIAILALVGRIVLNRGEVGGLKTGRIVVVVSAVVAAAVGFVLTDPYRVETMKMGEVGTGDLKGGYLIGREAASDVVTLDRVELETAPRFFTVAIDSVSETGYYRLKTSVESEVMRTVEVSREDEGKVAIERKTQLFEVTNRPSKASDYTAIYKVYLSGGQSILGVMPEYDAKAGRSRVVTLADSEGKIGTIAEKSQTDIKDYYIDGYDRARHTAHSETYLIYRGIGGLILGIVAVVVAMIVIRTKKR